MNFSRQRKNEIKMSSSIKLIFGLQLQVTLDLPWWKLQSLKAFWQHNALDSNQLMKLDTDKKFARALVLFVSTKNSMTALTFFHQKYIFFLIQVKWQKTLWVHLQWKFREISWHRFVRCENYQHRRKSGSRMGKKQQQPNRQQQLLQSASLLYYFTSRRVLFEISKKPSAVNCIFVVINCSECLNMALLKSLLDSRLRAGEMLLYSLQAEVHE